MMDTRVLLGTAPMTVSNFWPFLKIITVGMLRMPYSVATPGDSSVFSFSCWVTGGRVVSEEVATAAVRRNRDWPPTGRREWPACRLSPRGLHPSWRRVRQQLPLPACRAGATPTSPDRPRPP